MMNIDMSIPLKTKKSISRAPKSIVCYICGRNYMIHSFEIHEVQCIKLFNDRENLKPIKQRRKCPTSPFNLLNNNIDEMNVLASQSYTANLFSCKYCNRKFTEDKLIIHNKSCTFTNPARRVDESVNRRTSLSDIKQMEYSLHRIEISSSNSKNIMKSNQTILSSTIIPAELQQCVHCRRSFNDRSFLRHQRICKKVFVDKRKTFDSKKKRLDGIDDFQLKQVRKINSNILLNSKSSKNILNENIKQSSKWRQQSLQFRSAMKAARLIKKAQEQSKITGIPLKDILPDKIMNVPDNDYEDYVTCPTCNRKFNETAASRHIPKCVHIRNKPKVLIQGSGHIATTFRTENTRTTISRSTRNSFDIDMKKREIDLREMINDITIKKPNSANYVRK